MRCVLNLNHDPHEISLDETVTRTDLHPAGQSEAFRRLAEKQALDAEEIGARFYRLGRTDPRLSVPDDALAKAPRGSAQSRG